MKRYEINPVHHAKCNVIERVGDPECGNIVTSTVWEIDGNRSEKIGEYCYRHAQMVRRDFEQAELKRTHAERNP